MQKNHLAIDIGASSGRHIVGWMENGVLRTEEVYRFPNSVRRVDGHLEWDIDSLFAPVKQGIPMERGDAPFLSSGTWSLLGVKLAKTSTYTRIVFHDLRHSSATYQLMISGGDVKAVQGTTGHATADMLVNTYAHIQQSSRVELGRKFEEGFYAKQESPSPQAVPAVGEPTISMTALLELLKNADPEVKAQLRLALLT